MSDRQKPRFPPQSVSDRSACLLPTAVHHTSADSGCGVDGILYQATTDFLLTAVFQQVENVHSTNKYLFLLVFLDSTNINFFSLHLHFYTEKSFLRNVLYQFFVCTADAFLHCYIVIVVFLELLLWGKCQQWLVPYKLRPFHNLWLLCLTVRCPFALCTWMLPHQCDTSCDCQ